MKKIKLLPEDIETCDLLTKEEVLAAPKDLLQSNSWWWLRTTGFSKYYSLGVTKDGDIDDHDGYIHSVATVRPALYLKEPRCETGTRYQLCRRVFIAITPSILLYSDVELRSAFARDDANDGVYNSYDKSCVRELAVTWYGAFCDEMIRCNSIAPARMTDILHGIINSYAEGKENSAVMEYLCNIGLTSDELDALDYTVYANLMEDIENERLARLEDEEINVDVLAFLPDRRTVFADWNYAIAVWCKRNERAYSKEEIEKAAYTLTYANNSGRNFGQNIEEHFGEHHGKSEEAK